MLLQIITPQKTIFEGDVNLVTIPGKNGSFQIKKDHAPIVSSLSEGKVVFKTNSNLELSDESSFEVNNDGEYSFLIKDGILEMKNNKIILLAE